RQGLPVRLRAAGGARRHADGCARAAQAVVRARADLGSRLSARAAALAQQVERMKAAARERRTPLPERGESDESKVDRWCLGAAAPLLNAWALPKRRVDAFVAAVQRRGEQLAQLDAGGLADALGAVRNELLRAGPEDDDAAVAAFALV